MMNPLAGITLLLALISPGQILSTTVDIFDTTNGHEARVAINCGKVPFYTDLDTGSWVADSEGAALCDEANKEVVKKYCQKIYPKLNVTNIVEANEPVLFNNWCAPGEEECSTVKQVTPYRCLVHEYEADALMVPHGCSFDHIHDENLCMSHDEWKVRAKRQCKLADMKLRDYGILLSCGTDRFTGVEYVCCPRKKHVKKVKEPEFVITLPPVAIDVDAFSAAIKEFQKFLPQETKGCDRDQYMVKEAARRDRHRARIAAVVEEWDEAEKRYNKLSEKDPVAAEEKMKRTLEVFRETLAALEQEAKDEKSRLRVEHANCINTEISKNKRDAMIAYISAIEEKPPSAEKILETVRKFIQVCEHDRVHSLRHFEHVRNRDEEKANAMRAELLMHLRQLNTIVNNSMALLNYLPQIAEQFGLNDQSVMLKPRLVQPVYKPEPEHEHHEIPHVLRPINKQPVNTFNPTEDKPIYKPIDESHLVRDFKDHNLNEDEVGERYDDTHEKEREHHPHGKNIFDHRHHEHKHNKKHHEHEKEKEHHHKSHGHKKSAGFAAVIGLSCGALVIMLGILIALVVRRKRNLHTHVMIPTDDNDDQEHLVAMQKKGFENPTYKFYYY